MRNYNWIDKQEIPVSASLKLVRTTDPDYGMTQDEIDDRNEFIRCFIVKDFESLLMIPVQRSETDFFIKDFEDSAFNTVDYHREHPAIGFDKYAYRIRKILEEVQHLAILHSVLNTDQGRRNTLQRYESLINREFKNRIPAIEARIQHATNPPTKALLEKKSAELERRILECKEVWERYAPASGTA